MPRKRKNNIMERNFFDNVNNPLELVYNIIKINKGNY